MEYLIGFICIIVAIYLASRILSRPVRLTRKSVDEHIWSLVDSAYEELPQRPKDWSKEKNEEGVYLDRITVILDTKAVRDSDDVCRLVRVAGENSGFYPIYTTVHNNEEHYLTTLYLSFVKKNDETDLLVASMDPEFRLDSTNSVRFRFVNGKTIILTPRKAEGQVNGWHFTRLALGPEQLQLFKRTKLDKWAIVRMTDYLGAVGAFDFDVRPYIYKPEIQYTIECMANAIDK